MNCRKNQNEFNVTGISPRSFVYLVGPESGHEPREKAKREDHAELGALNETYEKAQATAKALRDKLKITVLADTPSAAAAAGESAFIGTIDSITVERNTGGTGYELPTSTKESIRKITEKINEWLNGTTTEGKKNIKNDPATAARKQELRIDLLVFEKTLAAIAKAKDKWAARLKEVRDQWEFDVGVWLQTTETLKALHSNPNYKKVVDSYQEGIKSSEFKLFHETHDHVEDETVAMEHQQLFLSLMMLETNNFADTCPLGMQFGDDPKVNRERFPFFYEQWIKEQNLDGPKNARDAATRGVKELTAKITESILDLSSSGITIPKDIKTMPADEAAAAKRIQTLEEAFRRYREKFKKDKNFTTNEAILKQYRDLAVAQRDLLPLEKRVQEIEQGFTRTKIMGSEAYRQKAMKWALLKFKKAKEIADGIFEQGGLSKGLNVHVRRMVIAQIYLNGVGRYVMRPDGTEIYEDTTQDYATVIKLLLESKHFNRGEPGQRLSDEQIAVIALAINGIGRRSATQEAVERAKDVAGVETTASSDYLVAYKVYQAETPKMRELYEASIALDTKGKALLKAYEAFPEKDQKLLKALQGFPEPEGKTLTDAYKAYPKAAQDLLKAYNDKDAIVAAGATRAGELPAIDAAITELETAAIAALPALGLIASSQVTNQLELQRLKDAVTTAQTKYKTKAGLAATATAPDLTALDAAEKALIAARTPYGATVPTLADLQAKDVALKAALAAYTSGTPPDFTTLTAAKGRFEAAQAIYTRRGESVPTDFRDIKTKYETRESTRLAYEAERDGIKTSDAPLYEARGTLVRAEIELADSKRDAKTMEDFLRDPDQLDKLEKVLFNPDVKEVDKTALKGTPAYAVYEILQQRGSVLLERAQNINIRYNILDLHRRGNIERITRELLGINMEGLYDRYQDFMRGLKDDNERRQFAVENWNELFQSPTPEGRGKLIEILRKIIPPDVEGGKERFLAILANIRGELPTLLLRGEETPRNDPETAALSLFGIIQNNLLDRGKTAERTAAQDFEFEQRREGRGVEGKLWEYGKNVWDMVWAPGALITKERLAAAALLAMALKTGVSAFKGSGPGSMLMKGGLFFLAASIIKKEVTGKYILESLSTHNLRNAYEGTHDTVLADDAKEARNQDPEKINEEQHYEVLRQLRNKPFRKVMQWYRTAAGSTTKGSDLMSEKSTEQFQALGIDTQAIYNWNKVQNKDPEYVGRYAVMRTVEWFATYVGKKESADQEYGIKGLENRWVDPLEDPKVWTGEKVGDGKIKREALRHTHWVPTETLRTFAAHPDDLTWERVKFEEVQMSDVQATVGRNWMDSGLAAAEGVVESVADFARTEILAPTKQKIGETWDTLKYDWGPKAKECVINLAEKGADKVWFTKEHVRLWFGANWVEMRRIGGDAVDLAATGVKLPFEIIVGFTKVAVPWADAKINGIRQTLREKYGQTEIPFPLIDKDLGSDTQTFEKGRKTSDAADRVPDFFQNPLYRHYLGKRYAPQFQKAWMEGGTDHYYVDKDPPSHEDYKGLSSTILDVMGPANVAYFVTEVTLTPEEKNLNPADRLLSMQDRAEDEAIEQFKRNNPDKTFSDDYFRKYLYSITEIAQYSSSPGSPEKLHVFYRIPLIDSQEWRKKEEGRWSDYYDPRRLKDHPPFIVDPNKGLLWNLKATFGASFDFAKPAGRAAGIAVAQLLRISLGTLDVATGVATDIAAWGQKEWSGKKKKKPGKRSVPPTAPKGPGIDWKKYHFTFDEPTRQALDEFLGSAANPTFALSDYYGKNLYHVYQYKQKEDYKDEDESETKIELIPTFPISNKPADQLKEIEAGNTLVINEVSGGTIEVKGDSKLVINKITKGPITVKNSDQVKIITGPGVNPMDDKQIKKE